MVSVWFGEGLNSRSRAGVVCVLFVAVLFVLRSLKVGLLAIMLVYLLGSSAMWRSHSEWEAVHEVRTGPYTGDAKLISDPQQVGRAVRVVLEIDGQRFECWTYGSSKWRMMARVAGEGVTVQGERRLVTSANKRRLFVRHIVGRFEVTAVSEIATGAHIVESRFELAANRVRAALGEGARTLPNDQSTLFAGLVYGDDSQQPPAMVERFRGSGLAHLTAVSGQNVAFVLAVVAPMLTRLRRWSRLTMTLLVLIWFATMTRLEPSVIRAVTMAGISASVLAIGGRFKAWQVLATTCVALLLIDPFLLWSVGWWLSVGGSSGLILLSSRIRSALECCGLKNHPWVLNWVVPSLAAQLGVLPFIVLVFGWPSAMSIPCNLLAVPIAGLVMLIGIPVALCAGFAPNAVAEIVMWPLGIGVKWIDTVAALGHHLNPPVWLDVFVALVPIVLLLRHRCGNLEA